MFCTCPLCCWWYSFLELTKTRITVHCLEAVIQFFFSDYLCAPFYKMVLEDTLVELMKKVRSEWWKNVAMGKFGPEWLINCTCKPLSSKFGGSRPCWCFVNVSSVFFTSWNNEWTGLPQLLGFTTHHGHRFSIQQATRHCSAIYAARMGTTLRTNPSAQQISMPYFPASIKESKIKLMQWWNRW